MASAWQYALAQHPMYLLLEEDTLSAERQWSSGAATIEAYVAKWERCLDALDRHPDLRFGFDTSAVELERLNARCPDLLQRLRSLAATGRIGFYNGTYAQPHLQHFSAEANYRQLARGFSTYQTLLGRLVVTHLAQECDAHEQLPQLLRAFGFEFAVVPRFFYAIQFLDPHELVSAHHHTLRYVQSEDFTRWVGLDGSEIPLYLAQHGLSLANAGFADRIATEHRIGLLHVPPIFVECPDMAELDDQFLAERDSLQPVVLDDALRHRIAEAPPHSRARLYTYWSYVEGVRAEELGRANQAAEATALHAEALGLMAQLLVDKAPDDLDACWQTILTAQHHDAYWAGATELRDKAIHWLGQATERAGAAAESAARSIAAAVDTTSLSARRPVLVFNPYPAPVRDVVVIDLPNAPQYSFLADVPGLGYRAYSLTDAMPTPIVEQCAAPIAVDHTHYRAVVNPDGTFRSLQVGPAHLELLDLTQPANLLRACAPDGAPLERGTTSPATLTTSPLGQVLRAAGTLGPDVHTDVEIRFYRELPRIDVRLRLTCRHAVIGDFFDDETKLNVYWPLGFDGDVYHDIPFGAVQTRRDRPFFPVSWVDVHDGQRGLAYFNRGTQRHRVRGRTLANVIAWGDDTDHFGNRLTARPATRSYDQRLRGTHLIEYALYPHLGPWTTAGVVQAARSYRAPLYAVATEHHTGPLPPEHGLLDVGPPNLVVTAIELRDRDLRVRLYESTGRATSPHVRAARLQPRALTTLDNQPLTHLPPFRIAHLDLSRP